MAFPERHWKPGFRHQVRRFVGSPALWECVDCGQLFEDWPPDDIECPGPARSGVAP